MKKAKILCVDDTYENLEVLLGLLKDYDVVVTLNAKSALKILQTQSIDMILLDIMMPDIDGFMLCEMIKVQEKLQDIPLLFISAQIDEYSIERGYELGAVDYVSKPFKPRELLARVKTHLKLSSLVHSLEDKVEQTLQKQRYQEHLLVKQSYAASMGAMIDVVAHQWKQPLNVINMRISNLLLDFKDEMVDEAYVKEFQEKSLNQIRHLVVTLNDFRSFMSPHQKVDDFTVQNMLASSLRLITDELDLHNIRLEIDTEQDFSIKAIETEFIHIVLNLIHNAKDALALKCIEKPFISIKVDEKQRAIYIGDNALGIENIDMVFDLHYTTKRSTGGSGLGLYMSQMIIDKYGGSISVKNDKDGALFTISI